MAGTVTTRLNLSTQADRYSYTKSYPYTDGFVVRQEVNNSDSFIQLIAFGIAKATGTLQGFKTLVVTNVGQTTAEINILVDEWAAGDPDTGGTTDRNLSMMLAPGEFLFLPNPRLLAYDANTSAANADDLDNVTPDSNLFIDSTQNLTDGLDNTTDPVTFNIGDQNWFKLHDLVRVDNEILEITALASSGHDVTVKRGMFGSTTASHADDADVKLPFFNMHHDFDDSSLNGGGNGSAVKVKTNKKGNFKAMNFFGYGRTADDKADGITQGSVSLKFYSEGGFQNLGMSAQTLASSTKLAVSTEYGFDLSCDGTNTTSDTIKFTTDSSDVTWGSSANGVLYKLNEIMTDNNLNCTVSIVNGDIQFKSATNHSATAILLAAPSAGETTPFGVGRIPAIAAVTAPVASFLPPDTITDKKTGLSSPNRAKMFYDNGDGTMSSGGAISGSGTINYRTGEIVMKGCPKNAEFVVSVSYQSAHSGGLATATATGFNMIEYIKARSVSDKLNTIIEVRGYR